MPQVKRFWMARNREDSPTSVPPPRRQQSEADPDTTTSAAAVMRPCRHRKGMAPRHAFDDAMASSLLHSSAHPPAPPQYQPQPPAPPLRVAGITIRWRFSSHVAAIPRFHPERWLAQALRLCAAAEERAQRHHAPMTTRPSTLRGDTNLINDFRSSHTTQYREHATFPPAALMVIDLECPTSDHPDDQYKSPTLRPLVKWYPSLVRSLRRLNMECDAAADCMTFNILVALATQLRELEIDSSRGLKSIRGLAGCCEHLRILTLQSCKALTYLDGVEHHLSLEVLNINYTNIVSLEPLRTCPALTKLDISCCRQLTSLEGLRGHRNLREIRISDTVISTLEPLRTCPALTTLELWNCRQLTSLDGLEGHSHLREVNISWAAIISVEPLRTCPALTKLNFENCRQLSSLKGLEDHQWLRAVDAFEAAITSLEPLLTCPALRKVSFACCRLLTSLHGLQDHAKLTEVCVLGSAITSVEPLFSCPALTHVHIDYCTLLTSLDGLQDHQFLQYVNASRTPITSIEPLLSCPNLETVSVRRCKNLRYSTVLDENVPGIRVKF